MWWCVVGGFEDGERIEGLGIDSLFSGEKSGGEISGN
jgi:hypothetical protein